MKTYIALTVVILALASTTGYLFTQNGKLSNTISMQQAEYNALTEAFDNQITTQNNAISKYKESMATARLREKTLNKALEDAAKENKCLYSILPDDVLNSMPR